MLVWRFSPLLFWCGWCSANDRQVAQQIVERLQEQKAKGTLANFSIDLQVKDGVVRLKGYVSRP